MAVTEEFLASKILQLVAVMSESLLVGSYFILIVLVCCILVTKYSKISPVLRILFAASVVMFIISAVHLGLVVQELGAKESPPENGQAQIIISMFQFLIGELILLWRLWVVWERSYWIVVIPIILIISGTGLTLNLLSSHDVFFTVAPVTLIVANAALCTSLIAGKIWYVGWKVRSIAEVAVKKKNSWWRGAAALIIESGVLYTAIQILSLILHYRKSVALPIVLDLQVPLIGILPTLIIALAHYNLPDEAVPHTAPSSNNLKSPSRADKIELGISPLDYHYIRRSESRGSQYQRHSTASWYAAWTSVSVERRLEKCYIDGTEA